MKKVFALRGACQCKNTVQDICEQVYSMYSDILESNNLEEKDIISIMFTVTKDINAINPCTALRKNGVAKESALFSAQEPDIKGSLERVIRLLIHCYLDESAKIKHIYKNGAEILRPDRTGT